MNLSWGKPILEVAKITNGVIGAYTALPIPVQDSTKLTPTAGDKQEAPIEGGDLEDIFYSKNKYAAEFEIRKSKGRVMPIGHNDGVIVDEYAFRLTPEDPSVPGWQMPRGRFHVEPSWDAKNGEKWKYVFDALIPYDGDNKLREYDGSGTAKVVLNGANYLMTAAITAINANGGTVSPVATAQMIQAAFAAMTDADQDKVIAALGAGS